MNYYVYILRSINSSEHIYIRFTTNIKKRVEYHNSGMSYHTSKFKPWRLETYITFTDKRLALDFEKYLKVGSGNAFMKKRLIK
jgi:predicted GIY-YIG superfamily endonuclease